MQAEAGRCATAEGGWRAHERASKRGAVGADGVGDQHGGRETCRGAACSGGLLDVGEQVALEDVLPLFVLLRRFEGPFLRGWRGKVSKRPRYRTQETHIFPAKNLVALDAVDVAYGVRPGRHRAVARFALLDVYAKRRVSRAPDQRTRAHSHHIEEVRAPMLPVEGLTSGIVSTALWRRWRGIGLTLERIAWIVARCVLHVEQP